MNQWVFKKNLKNSRNKKYNKLLETFIFTKRTKM